MAKRLKNMLRTFPLILTASLLLSACSRQTVPLTPGSNGSEDFSPSFVNTVWRVSLSTSVEPGTLYVFLSEGTLLITSSHSKPALGTWKYENAVLTMVEEGIPYKADIVKLSKDEFKIRIHNPGEPVEMTLIPADGRPLPK